MVYRIVRDILTALMRRGARHFGRALGIFILGLVLPAKADEITAEDRALAEALFREGKALLEAGRTEPACRKLEESRRIESAGGVVLTLAICLEKLGKNASAWAEYQVALGLARRDRRADREELIRERLLMLEPKLHWVAVGVAAANGTLPEFEVRRNETRLQPASWGTRVALDPGEYVIVASARGHATWRSTLSVPATAGETAIEVPLLVQAQPAPAGTAIASEPARVGERGPRVSVSRGGRGTERVAGIALAAAGVVGLGAAGYFSLASIGARARVDGACQDDICPSSFEDDHADALSWDRAAIVSSALGLVSGGAGAYLLVRAASGDGAETAERRSSKTRTWLGVALGGAGVGALALASVFAVNGVADSNRAWAKCKVGLCDDAARADFDRAVTDGNVAMILGSAGLAAAGAGVYLLATSSQVRNVNAGFSARLGGGLGRLEVGGTF